jgi:hypothetical protein
MSHARRPIEPQIITVLPLIGIAAVVVQRRAEFICFRRT